MGDKISIVKLNIIGVGIILLVFVGAFFLNLFVNMHRDPLESSVDSVVMAIDELSSTVSSEANSVDGFGASPSSETDEDVEYESLIYGYMDPTLNSGLQMTVSNGFVSSSSIVSVDKNVDVAVYPQRSGDYIVYARELSDTGKRYIVYESRLEAYVPPETKEAENLLQLSLRGPIDDHSLGDHSRAERMWSNEEG